MYEDAELITAWAARSMVPLFLDDTFAGSAILLRERDAFFILTARHVLINEETAERYPGELSFAAPSASGSPHPFALPNHFIGTLPGTDAAVVPIVSVEPTQRHHLDTVCTSADLLAARPGDASLARAEVFIAGYPAELCYFEDTQRFLAPFLYASHLPPSEVQENYPEFLAWIPPTDVWNLANAETSTVPNLKGASGGPWFVVEREGDEVAVKVLATHRRRIPEQRDDGMHYIACGCPIRHHAAVVADARAAHPLVRE